MLREETKRKIDHAIACVKYGATISESYYNERLKEAQRLHRKLNVLGQAYWNEQIETLWN